MLIGLRVENFGILQDAMVGVVGEALRTQGPGAGMTPVTALIGRNSTGKSTVLEALSFLSDCLKDGIPSAASMERRGGFTEMRTIGAEDTMTLEVAVGISSPDCILDYVLQIGCDPHGRPLTRFESVSRLIEPSEGTRSFQEILHLEEGRGFLMEESDPASIAPTRHEAGITDLRKPGLSSYGTLLGYPLLHSLYQIVTRWYFCRFDADAARHLPAAGGHHHVSETGDNLANVLHYLEEENPKELQAVLQRISALMPDLGAIRTSRAPDGKLLLRFNGTNGGGPVYLHRLSEGARKLFTYLLLMEDPSPRPLVCFEEPEAGLYHDRIDPLAAQFRRLASRRNPGQGGAQVLFTTHHPYLLDSLRPEEVWVLERQPDGLAKARRVGDDPIVQGMFSQGIGMAALWYGSYFDRT